MKQFETGVSVCERIVLLLSVKSSRGAVVLQLVGRHTQYSWCYKPSVLSQSLGQVGWVVCSH